MNIRSDTINNTLQPLLKFFLNVQIHDEERRSVGVTPEKYSRQLSSLFENKFDLKRGSLPLVFIDTHYNRYFILRNLNELIQKKKAFNCMINRTKL